MTAARETAPADSGSDGTSPRPGPLHALTGLRLVAALAVYFSHVAAPAGAPDWLLALQKSGYAGVTFFFVLSGFVLALNYFDTLRTPQQVWSYAAARLARVYPLYLAVLSWPAVHLWASGELAETHLLQKVLGVQAWNPDLTVAFGFVGPAWSISVELFLYATLPLLVPVLRLLDRQIATILASIAVVLAVLFVLAYVFEAAGRGDLAATDPSSAHRWLYRTPLSRVGDFVIGILAARLYLRIRDRKSSRRLSAVLIPTSIAATCLLAATPDLVNSAWSWDAMYAPPAVALILGLALAPRHAVSRLLSVPVVVFLGEASFAFYLIHITVTRMVDAGSWADGVTVRTVVLELFNLAFALVVAVGLHVGIERPCRVVVKRFLDPPRRSRARRVPPPEPREDREDARPEDRSDDDRWVDRTDDRWDSDRWDDERWDDEAEAAMTAPLPAIPATRGPARVGAPGSLPMPARPPLVPQR